MVRFKFSEFERSAHAPFQGLPSSARGGWSAGTYHHDVESGRSGREPDTTSIVPPIPDPDSSVISLISLRYPGYPVGPGSLISLAGTPDAPIPDLDSWYSLMCTLTLPDIPDSTQASTLADAAQTRPRIPHSKRDSVTTALHSQLAVFGFSVTNFRVPVASSVALC
jgi:hypothetical protein